MANYEKELHIATLAVQKAALLTKTVSKSLSQLASLEKPDNTPVTLADLGAQAILIAALHAAFPSDSFLGEESAQLLRGNLRLAKRVWLLVSSTRLEDEECEKELAGPRSEEEMLDLIDLGGKGEGGSEGRCWIMDPIDGTATYLRGQQYAVCLCLIVNGVQHVGVLACPNMSLKSSKVGEDAVTADGESGWLLSAVKGRGAWVRKLSWGRLEEPARVQLRRERPKLKDLVLVESLANTSMDHKMQKQVADKLGCEWPGTDIWSLQMKYIACAVGGHDAVIRIPKENWHRTQVWDHSGGHLIYEEAGGKVTDMHGKEIDFGAGRRCYNNIGNVIAPSAVHEDILRAVQEVLEQSK